MSGVAKQHVFINFEGHPKMLLKHVVFCKTAALRKAAMHWHRVTAKKHFTGAGARRYKYADREYEYQRIWGGCLSHSGLSEDRLTATMRLSWKGTKGRVRAIGKFNGPDYFFIKGGISRRCHQRQNRRNNVGCGKQPDKFDEFSRMTDPERRAQASIAHNKFMERFSRIMRRRSRRRIL